MRKYLTVRKTESKPLYVLGTFDVGGAETFVLNLVRADEPLDAACVIPDHGAYEDEMIEHGCRTFHMTRRSTSIVRHHLDLWHIIHDNGYKTVYFHTQNAFLTSLHVMTAKCAGAQTIAVHSHNTKDWRSGKSLSLHRLFRKWLYRHSDIKLACGKDAAIWLFGTTDNVNILPLPVKCDDFMYSDEKKTRIRKDLGIPNNTTVYLHIGRFDEVKNHKFLLDVFSEICSKRQDSLLILAGAGELMEEMKIRTKVLGIENKVLFMGITNRVPELAIAADKMIFPSIYEGFPTVLLEAQAAGLSCFVSDSIDKDIAVTDESVRFISLEKTSREWADIIMSGQINSERVRQANNIKVSEKYDIFAVQSMIHKIFGINQ